MPAAPGLRCPGAGSAGQVQCVGERINSNTEMVRGCGAARAWDHLLLGRPVLLCLTHVWILSLKQFNKHQLTHRALPYPLDRAVLGQAPAGLQWLGGVRHYSGG